MAYYNILGLDYTRTLSKHWDIYSGIEYMPDIEMGTIPVQLKYNFEKLIFLKGGMLFNIEVHHQFHYFSFGCELGMGLKHDFNSGISLYLNPYARLNGYTLDPFLQAGVKLGVGYRF